EGDDDPGDAADGIADNEDDASDIAADGGDDDPGTGADGGGNIGDDRAGGIAVDSVNELPGTGVAPSKDRNIVELLILASVSLAVIGTYTWNNRQEQTR